MSDNPDIRHAINTPAETARKTVRRIEQMEKNRHRAMPLHLDRIGNYLAPLQPGELCGVLAQTHNYKTGFMTMWERMLAAHLHSQGRDNEVIFHIDTENAVETLGVHEAARLSSHSVADLSRGNVRDWAEIIIAADKIADIEIYRIASSLGRDDVPDLYLSNIYRAIQYAVSGELYGRELKPACIFVDYLQALPLDPEVKRSTRDMDKQRRLQVREDVYRLRRMANHFACPVVMGVQAKQKLEWHPGPNMMIPGIYDGEETSAIAQRIDRYLSLWMPKMTHTVGDFLKHGSVNFTVEENMIWVKVLKQRGGLPSGRAWKCFVDFHKNEIEPAS
ncbi:MAG: DnaB-like helicase C-terminal domain-containing protein [Chloroflexota bacterium]